MPSKKVIMVVSREVLFQSGCFHGFVQKRFSGDFEDVILKNHLFMARDEAESNPKFKQPIAYIVIVNPVTRKVFVFRRSNRDDRYPEKRLQGKLSCGVGGHLEQQDTQEGNPIRLGATRELGEEVIIEGSSEIVPIGFINDDSDDVGKVHFGVVYLVKTQATRVQPKDPEVESGSYYSLEELDQLMQSSDVVIENWSRLIINQMRDILNL
ncbi:MAG: NUDIX domain-containing protein [Candidatus Paceibacterota bacterium]